MAEEAQGEAHVPTEKASPVDPARVPPPDEDARRAGHRPGPPAEGPRSPVGPAVVRNRLRRRLREAVRDLDRTTGGLAPGAYLITLRPEAARLGYHDLRRDLEQAIDAASRTPSSGGSR